MAVIGFLFCVFCWPIGFSKEVLGNYLRPGSFLTKRVVSNLFNTKRSYKKKVVPRGASTAITNNPSPVGREFELYFFNTICEQIMVSIVMN